MRTFIQARSEAFTLSYWPSCHSGSTLLWPSRGGPTRPFLSLWRSPRFSARLGPDIPSVKAPRFANDQLSGSNKRTLSTLADASVSSSPREDDFVSETPATGTTEDIEALQEIFLDIIQDGQPDQVMDALLDQRFTPFVASMPQSTFVEVFQLLSPAYFVDPYREIHRPLHPTFVEIKQYRSLDSIFDEFVHRMVAIARVRQAAGHVLGLAEYTHLLDCARAIGDAEMADNVWESMQDDEVAPDVHCYNHYMGAKIWDKAFTGRERYRLRMTPYLYRKRRFEHPAPGFEGYGTAGRSVRKEVLRIFKEMTEAGQYPDETTFVNVMLASSRVGHVQGIKGVLKTAWNVDVDALLETNDESKIPSVTEYNRSSPLYPTERLLFAVAHAFGTNSDMGAALKAINFISSSYDIPVPEKVWLELMERSFVLSRQRFGPDAQRNRKGRVSYNFFTSLVQTMRSEPINVRPTVEMHHYMAKTAWDRSRLSEFQHHMREAYALLREDRKQLHEVRRVLQEYLGCTSNASPIPGSQVDPELLQTREFADIAHTYDILRWRTAQQTMMMERLAKLLLFHSRWVGRDNPAWERCLLPQALEEWRDFLPQALFYGIKGGQIQIMGKTRWGHARLTAHKRIPVQQPTAVNGVSLDHVEARRLDEDFFWDRLRASSPHIHLDSPPLQRLFNGLKETDLSRKAMYSRRRAPTEERSYSGSAPPELGALQEDLQPSKKEKEYPSEQSLPEDFVLA